MLCANKRDSIAHTDLFLTGESQCQGGIFSLYGRFTVLHGSTGQDTGFLRCLVCFGIQIDLCFLIYILKTTDSVSITFQLSIPTIEHQISRSIFLERKAINRALVRWSIIDLDIRLIQIYLISIRDNLFPIVTILDNRFQTRLLTLIRTQVESRTTSMACHDERQPTQPVSRKITTFGIDTQHAVRQMDGRISRH